MGTTDTYGTDAVAFEMFSNSQRPLRIKYICNRKKCRDEIRDGSQIHLMLLGVLKVTIKEEVSPTLH